MEVLFGSQLNKPGQKVEKTTTPSQANRKLTAPLLRFMSTHPLRRGSIQFFLSGVLFPPVLQSVCLERMADWQRKVASSKFSTTPALHLRGHFGLPHILGVAFWNDRIVSSICQQHLSCGKFLLMGLLLFYQLWGLCYGMKEKCGVKGRTSD